MKVNRSLSLRRNRQTTPDGNWTKAYKSMICRLFICFLFSAKDTKKISKDTNLFLNRYRFHTGQKR